MKNNIRTKELKEGEIIPLNFDFVFTSIFTNPDNMIIIENFVSCLLDLDLKLIKGNIKILNRNLSVENKKERNKVRLTKTNKRAKALFYCIYCISVIYDILCNISEILYIIYYLKKSKSHGKIYNIIYFSQNK